MNIKNNLRKKIQYIVIILTLLFSTAAGLTPSTISGEETDSKDFTHAVFGELASTTT